ncbi:hypothetical protein OESDEN_22857 [Oesophagostomum dentatum]|uniref:Uncharacterized protein n=1 Tax=Oesophagostomum dentatum TaxID=61180 RepID=A0A0B1RWR4_OESDE|nr:hypothetical protein OESDEN_22857 [Oesophagostomum dentatum]
MLFMKGSPILRSAGFRSRWSAFSMISMLISDHSMFLATRKSDRN